MRRAARDRRGRAGGGAHGSGTPCGHGGPRDPSAGQRLSLAAGRHPRAAGRAAVDARAPRGGGAMTAVGRLVARARRPAVRRDGLLGQGFAPIAEPEPQPDPGPVGDGRRAGAPPVPAPPPRRSPEATDAPAPPRPAERAPAAPAASPPAPPRGPDVPRADRPAPRGVAGPASPPSPLTPAIEQVAPGPSSEPAQAPPSPPGRGWSAFAGRDAAR